MTGAAGFLGRALVERLVRRGVAVRALVRRPGQAQEMAHLGATPVLGDVRDPQALGEALEGVQVVYHLAGKLLEAGVPADHYVRTHVEGTRVLLGALRSHPGLERLVHCSTTGVLGATGQVPAGERAPLRPSNVYEQTKAEAEQAVLAAASDGLPAVVVRPGLVYGPGDLHLVGFFRAVLRRQFRAIGRRPVWLHPLYIDDMTDALLVCGVHPSAPGQIFHIAAPEPVELERLAATIAAAGGTTLPKGHLPLPAAWVLAALGDALPAPLRHLAPLTTSRLAFLTHSRVYDVAKARRVLGFSASTGLATGVARTLSWYQDQGYLAQPARPELVGV